MHRIAIIEDSDAEILLLRIALDHAGLAYQLSEFSSGDSALQALSDGEPTPDLIITDANLPRIGLAELLVGLKQLAKLQAVPIIVISGMTDQRLTQRALANGAKDYIVKPSDLEGWLAIGQRIKQLMEGGGS